MSETTERLADILAHGIVTQEGFARELAEVSEALRRDGHHASAEAMLRLCHHHRIRGMEDRGNLAALRAMPTMTLPSDRHGGPSACRRDNGVAHA